MYTNDKIMNLEHNIQANIFKTIWNTFPKFRRQLFAVPNGGKRNLIEASRLKQTGTIPGIPDLIFVAQSKTFFFELKNEKGKLSDEQKIVISKFKENKFPVYVVRSEIQFYQIFLFLILEHMKTEFTDEQIQQSYSDLLKVYDIKVFGLSFDELKYQNKVFEYIFNLPLDERVEIASICSPENNAVFIETIRKFVIFEMDVANGFFIQLSADLKFFQKNKTNLNNGKK